MQPERRFRDGTIRHCGRNQRVARLRVALRCVRVISLGRQYATGDDRRQQKCGELLEIRGELL